jgi:hypothetical protein
MTLNHFYILFAAIIFAASCQGTLYFVTVYFGPILFHSLVDFSGHVYLNKGIYGYHGYALFML